MVSSCWIASTLGAADCFSYVILSIPDELVSVSVVLPLWNPAEEMTPPVPEFMFWSTLVWLFTPWLVSLAMELGVGVKGDALPTPCWMCGLARWFPDWWFVKCWYKLPCVGTADPCTVGDTVGGWCWCWAWFVTIVDTAELLLLVLLLLFVVGNWIPGTVVAEDNGTETTRLSGCGCWRSSFEPPLNFACIFCVITWGLLFAGDVVDATGVTLDETLVTVVEPVEWITFGFTFWMFGSWVGAVAVAGVDCVFISVLA